jgi:hypothetical protein
MACRSSGRAPALFRGWALTQAGGRSGIDAAVGTERDPIVAFCNRGRIKAVGDIGGDLRGIALGGIAKAAATG